MNSLLIAFLIVLIVPLILATWRTSLLGLSLQGLLMGCMANGAELIDSPDGVVTLLDLFVVRGIVVPYVLYRVLRACNTPKRNDVIPPNLLSWSAAGILVVLAFRFAGRIDTSADSGSHVHFAVASAALLLGLFVLATQTGTFSQVVGALRIENAIALFELSADKPVAPVPVQVGQLVVFVATAALYASYVRRLAATVDSASTAEGPAL